MFKPLDWIQDERYYRNTDRDVLDLAWFVDGAHLRPPHAVVTRRGECIDP